MGTMADVRERLLDFSAQIFLEKDFHSVSIRQLAQGAKTSSAMINYYFGSKHGLFEEMVKLEHGKVLAVLDEIMHQKELLNFSDIIKNVMEIYQLNPNMPKFIIKTLLFRQGPGSQFLQETFETERMVVGRWVEKVIKEGKIDRDINAEVVRIIFMCLTLMPSMMADSLKTSYGEQGYEDFLEEFSRFSGEILNYGLIPKSRSKKTKS
jgi:AcrR family transcriptional regulator